MEIMLQSVSSLILCYYNGYVKRFSIVLRNIISYDTVSTRITLIDVKSK